jgi:hypothetical protein
MKEGRKHRRPFAWSVAMLDELEGAGVEDRQEQAKSMGVSLPQIDRIRRALRDDDRRRHGFWSPRKMPVTKKAPTGLVQLGVRVPASISARLRRHAGRAGVSVALLVTVALDEWLTGRGTPGPSPLPRKERETLSL